VAFTDSGRPLINGEPVNKILHEDIIICLANFIGASRRVVDLLGHVNQHR